MADYVHDDGFDEPAVNKARGVLRHVAGLVTPDAAAGLGAVLQRDVPLRLSRLGGHVINGVTDPSRDSRHRRRPWFDPSLSLPAIWIGRWDWAGHRSCSRCTSVTNASPR